MKSTGELLEEMGFRKDAPRDTQKAFLKHLLHAAGIKPLNTQENIVTVAPKIGEQMTFNFDDCLKIS